MAYKPTTNVCAQCAKIFQQVKASDKFCSPKCEQTYKITKGTSSAVAPRPEPTIPAICAHCNSAFLSSRPSTKYCLVECVMLAKGKHPTIHSFGEKSEVDLESNGRVLSALTKAREDNLLANGGQLPPICCAHCGTSFTPGRSTVRFCSAECRIRANSLNRDKPKK
jgi:hypothetical protein